MFSVACPPPQDASRYLTPSRCLSDRTCTSTRRPRSYRILGTRTPSTRQSQYFAWCSVCPALPRWYSLCQAPPSFPAGPRRQLQCRARCLARDGMETQKEDRKKREAPLVRPSSSQHVACASCGELQGASPPSRGRRDRAACQITKSFVGRLSKTHLALSATTYDRVCYRKLAGLVPTHQTYQSLIAHARHAVP